MDFIQSIVDFLTSLFAALGEFLGGKSDSSTGSFLSDFLASVREYIGAEDTDPSEPTA